MSAAKRSGATVEGRTVLPLIERPRGHFLAVRECYVAICRGDVIAAALLDVLCSWTKSRLKAIGDPERRDEERRRVRGGGRIGGDCPLWVYRTIAQLEEDMRQLASENPIARARRNLEKWGFIRAEQPGGIDRTWHFLVRAGNVERALRGFFADRSWREIASGSTQPIALPEHDFAMVDDALLSICTIEGAGGTRPDPVSAALLDLILHGCEQRQLELEEEEAIAEVDSLRGRTLGGEPVVAALRGARARAGAAGPLSAEGAAAAVAAAGRAWLLGRTAPGGNRSRPAISRPPPLDRGCPLHAVNLRNRGGRFEGWSRSI